MDPTNSDTRSTDEALSLGGHALESRRNPGEYIANTGVRTWPPKERYRIKYARIFEHSKIDLRHNAEQAHEMTFGQWVEMCRDGGPWDFESDPSMQEGVKQGLYTRELLVSFRRFHAGFTSAALGVRIESRDKWTRHLGFDWNDEALRQDFGLGWLSYWFYDDRDKPRNHPSLRPRHSAS